MRTRPVVVAVVVGTAVALALGVRVLADDASSPGGGGVTAEAGDCPPVTEDQRRFQMPEPLPGSPDTIADGAERVWLCEGPGSPLDVPADALRSGVDGIAQIINAMPTVEVGEPQECPSDGGPGYRLRFQYADGTVADAVGQLYGCGDVQVGSTLHTGDREGEALREFIALLRAQREAVSPPGPPEQPACTYDDETVFGPVSPVGLADEMVAAALCAWDGRGIGGPADRAVDIPADDLAVLMADYPTHLSDRQPTGRECRAGRQLAIQGVTAWGDRVLMTGYCSVFLAVGTRPTGAADGDTDYWRPGPDARAILDRLLGTDPVSVAPCPSGPDVPLDAEEPDAEPGTIPTGASSVRLCLGPGLGFQEPADALVTDVDTVVDAVNGLEPLDLAGGCTRELGLGYRLVFTYPDGTTTDAVGQLYGCGSIEVGGIELGGSDAPWGVIRAALREQRAATKPPGMRFGPTCRGPSGGQREQVSPVALPSEMAEAVLCVMDPGSSETTRRSRIKEDVLRMLLEDREAHSDDREPTDAECAADRRVFVLRGVTAWDDRVAISGYCGLLVDPGRFPDGEVTYWRPGPEAQAVIDRLYAAAEPLRSLG